MSDPFVSLHNHSSYSILDGLGSVDSMVRRAAELGQPALAVTDHGSLSGLYDLWKAGTEHGVKPIAGLEAYVAPEGRDLKERVIWGELEGKQTPGPYTHMTLLAQSAEGLRNLYRLQQAAYLEGFYHKPRLDLDLLEKHSVGVIALTGCAGGALATRLRLGHHAEADTILESLRAIYPDRVYVELMDHGIPFEQELNKSLLEIAAKHDAPLVLTNDAHYTTAEEAEAHDALLCVQTQAHLTDQDRFRFSGSGYWLRSAAEMAALGYPTEGVANTLLIAESIESYDTVFEYKDRSPVSDSPYSLRDVVESVVERQQLSQQYIDRAEYELEIIEDAGYGDIILVVGDLVNFARSRSILVGPGRGSAGGSLVCYLVGITQLDPIAHGLLFERFLNPHRLSPPDIDIDFQDDRRGEVIEYAVNKYGADCVSQIVTFGMVKARSAIGDAARVTGLSFREGQELAQMVPEDIRGRQHPLEGLTKLQEANPAVYGLAQGLEGTIRSTGKHAAGIIISPEPLEAAIPTQKGPKDELLVAGYSQETLEALGYQKLDLLGLKELSVIERTIGFINEEDSGSGSS